MLSLYNILFSTSLTKASPQGKVPRKYKSIMGTSGLFVRDKLVLIQVY